MHGKLVCLSFGTEDIKVQFINLHQNSCLLSLDVEDFGQSNNDL